MAFGDSKILESMQKFGIKGVSVEQMRSAIEHYTASIAGNTTAAWVTKVKTSAGGEYGVCYYCQQTGLEDSMLSEAVEVNGHVVDVNVCKMCADSESLIF